jgi:hypothetical protein
MIFVTHFDTKSLQNLYRGLICVTIIVIENFKAMNITDISYLVK